MLSTPWESEDDLLDEQQLQQQATIPASELADVGAGAGAGGGIENAHPPVTLFLLESGISRVEHIGVNIRHLVLAFNMLSSMEGVQVNCSSHVPCIFC